MNIFLSEINSNKNIIDLINSEKKYEIKDGKLNSVPLECVVGENKKIGAVSGNTPESNIRKVSLDDDLVKTARHIGINLGD